MELLTRVPEPASAVAESAGGEGSEKCEKKGRVPLRIGVASAQRGAGTSFIASLIAFRAAEGKADVCLCEPAGSYFYAALGMDRRFVNREFEPLLRALEAKRPLRRIRNVEFGVNWLLRAPGELRPLSEAELFRLIAMPPGDICVYDLSGLSGEALTGALAEMDSVALVFDPLPSKLIPAYGQAERLRLSFPDAVIVVDRMNKGVHRAELQKYLGTRSFISVPALPAESIYKAEYNCVPAALQPENKKLLAGVCKELADKLGI